MAYIYVGVAELMVGANDHKPDLNLTRQKIKKIKLNFRGLNYFETSKQRID